MNSENFNQLFANESDDVKAKLELELTRIKIDAENKRIQNVKNYEESKKAEVDSKTKEFHDYALREITKIQKDGENTRKEIENAIEDLRKKTLEEKEQFKKQSDAQISTNLKLLQEKVQWNLFKMDAHCASLKKDLSTRGAELTAAHKQQLAETTRNIADIENLQSELFRTKKEEGKQEFLELLAQKTQVIDEGFQLEKLVNDEDNSIFKEELKQLKEIDDVCMKYLTMLLEEQRSKFESDKRNQVRLELAKLVQLKESLQQSKDLCLVVSFPTRSSGKIDDRMRRHMESLRAQFYRLSGQITVMERKMAELEVEPTLREQIKNVKVNNTKITAAITNYLRHNKIEGIIQDQCERAFVDAMDEILNSIDDIVMLDSGRKMLNGPKS